LRRKEAGNQEEVPNNLTKGGVRRVPKKFPPSGNQRLLVEPSCKVKQAGGPPLGEGVKKDKQKKV